MLLQIFGFKCSAHDTRTAASPACRGLVFVASTLLAFAIDALWEEHQQSKARLEPIDLLISDFEATQERLSHAIASAQSHSDKNTRLLEILSDGEQINRDEFSTLAYSFVTFDEFAAALSTYEAAVGRDGLASIQSVPFSRATATFYARKRLYDIHVQIATEMYYMGSMNDIRNEVGSLGVLLRGAESCTGRSCIYPEQLNMNMEELREFMLRPMVFAGFESARIVQTNMLQSLQGMEAAATTALAELKSMR